jgi:hypothetical protein
MFSNSSSALSEGTGFTRLHLLSRGAKRGANSDRRPTVSSNVQPHSRCPAAPQATLGDTRQRLGRDWGSRGRGFKSRWGRRPGPGRREHDLRGSRTSIRPGCTAARGRRWPLLDRGFLLADVADGRQYGRRDDERAIAATSMLSTERPLRRYAASAVLATALVGREGRREGRTRPSTRSVMASAAWSPGPPCARARRNGRDR